MQPSASTKLTESNQAAPICYYLMPTVQKPEEGTSPTRKPIRASWALGRRVWHRLDSVRKSFVSRSANRHDPPSITISQVTTPSRSLSTIPEVTTPPRSGYTPEGDASVDDRCRADPEHPAGNTPLLSTLHATTLPQQQCALLNLPPEIRNTIYEFIFAVDTTEPVDLLKATPPSKSLITTCRQIFGETSLLYRDAYRSYWRDNEFNILHSGESTSTTERAALYKALAEIDKQDLAQIQRLTVNDRVDSGYREWRSGIWTLWHVDEDQGWKVGWAQSRFPPEQSDALERAGFVILPIESSALLTSTIVHHDGPERAEEAKKILNYPVLTLESIMSVLRLCAP